jgi:hypothetical protein
METKTTYLTHIYPLALPFIQWLIVSCLCSSAYLLVAHNLRSQPNLFTKIVIAVALPALAIAVSYLILTSEPLLVAKLVLIAVSIGSGLLCLLSLLNIGRFYRTLTAIRKECELMTNLTFLQGEMTRAQLEQLHERIRQAVQSQRPSHEIGETMLRSLSPLVMLFLRKEKSIIQWSLAAANIGRGMLKYFWSER